MRLEQNYTMDRRAARREPAAPASAPARRRRAGRRPDPRRDRPAGVRRVRHLRDRRRQLVGAQAPPPDPGRRGGARRRAASSASRRATTTRSSRRRSSTRAARCGPVTPTVAGVRRRRRVELQPPARRRARSRRAEPQVVRSRSTARPSRVAETVGRPDRSDRRRPRADGLRRREAVRRSDFVDVKMTEARDIDGHVPAALLQRLGYADYIDAQARVTLKTLSRRRERCRSASRT